MLNDFINKHLNIFVSNQDLFYNIRQLSYFINSNFFVYTNSSYINGFIKLDNLPINKKFDIIIIDSKYIYEKLIENNIYFNYIITDGNNIINNINYIDQYYGYYLYEISKTNLIQVTLKDCNISQFYKYKNKIITKPYVIYSANIGNYDKFKDQSIYNTTLFDYILITNKQNIPNIKLPWKCIVIQDIIDINKFKNILINKEQLNKRLARFCKIMLPQLLFYNYKKAIWIDGNTDFTNNPINLITKFNIKYNLFAPMHPGRNCIYQQAKVCYDGFPDEQTNIKKQLIFLYGQHYPINNGLVQTNIYIQDNIQIIHDIMKLWWKIIYNYSYRDQLSFNYACWKYNIKYDTCKFLEVHPNFIKWNAGHQK